jgi:hypothetical protein
VSLTTLAELRPYPGLPSGAFHERTLPAQAIAARGNVNDEGVWSAAVSMHLNAVDPRTGRPYNADVPLEHAAEGAVEVAASNCRSTAIAYSAASDELAVKLLADAARHLSSAVDQMENSASILQEAVPDPDGGLVTVTRLQVIHEQDQALAQQRSAEGDSRHTQSTLETAWRLIAASMLALLDVLLLWKPLLNLTWEANSGAVFRWSIGAGLAGLQVLFIEWAMRSYVTAERTSVDRRGAVDDFNRALSVVLGRKDQRAPNREEVVDADRQMDRAYRLLTLAAAFIAVIGGVRVAVLARRAALPIYEAAVFATIIGIILGAVVVLLARLYCRGNLLGDRLESERAVLTEIDGRIQHVRGAVAQEREDAQAAMTGADLAAKHAAELRYRTATDYWRAVQLAWTWFGLRHSLLDYDDFQRRALPVPNDTDAGRATVRENLDLVGAWLANRPVLLTAPAPVPVPTAAAVAALTAREDWFPNASNLPALPPSVAPPPALGPAVVYRPEAIELPAVPKPPHWWMLAGVVATILAAVTTAWLAPSLDEDEVSAMASGLSISGTVIVALA